MAAKRGYARSAANEANAAAQAFTDLVNAL